MKAQVMTMWVNGSAWRVEKTTQGYRSQLINAHLKWHSGIPPGTKQSQVDRLFERLAPPKT